MLLADNKNVRPTVDRKNWHTILRLYRRQNKHPNWHSMRAFTACTLPKKTAAFIFDLKMPKQEQNNRETLILAYLFENKITNSLLSLGLNFSNSVSIQFGKFTKFRLMNGLIYRQFGHAIHPSVNSSILCHVNGNHFI